MGVKNCCIPNNHYEDNKQINFVNENILIKTDSNKNIFTCIDKNNKENIKNNFENVVKYCGEIIEDKTIEQILEEINPLANKISLPDHIVNYSEPNCSIYPPIKFTNGEIYKGSWNLNNQRHGYGINISQDKNIFKGLWKEDKVSFYGLFLDFEGNYYMGELKDGKSNGKGEMVIKGKSKYVGSFENDYPNGNGILENYDNGTKYTGEILNGVKNGKGVLEYKDGTIYDGNFKNDVYEGFGVIKFPNNRKYEGDFHEGKIKGKGKFTWEDGKVYEGEYDDFMKKGFGKFYWNENKYYEGQWLNNKQHGKGTLHFDGKEINGTFRFGKIIKENKIE